MFLLNLWRNFICSQVLNIQGDFKSINILTIFLFFHFSLGLCKFFSSADVIYENFVRFSNKHVSKNTSHLKIGIIKIGIIFINAKYIASVKIKVTITNDNYIFQREVALQSSWKFNITQTGGRLYNIFKYLLIKIKSQTKIVFINKFKAYIFWL